MLPEQQKRLLRFAYHTLLALDPHDDQDRISSIEQEAIRLGLADRYESGQFRPIASENDPIPLLPFNDHEIDILFNIAHVALSYDDIFTEITESLDMPDDQLKSLQDKLHKYMNYLQTIFYR